MRRIRNKLFVKRLAEYKKSKYQTILDKTTSYPR